MSGLRAAAENYVAIRRSLGFKLNQTGRLLPDFIDYLDNAGAATITTDLALAWATLPAGADPAWWGQRLSVVRCFARYLQTIDPNCEVPPAGLVGSRPQRATPYLFSPADIARLIAAARTLAPPLRAATCHTLIGLAAVTGMRIGEVLALDRDDVDLAAGLLTIRHAKGDTTRQLPLHASVVEALAAYTAVRDQHFPTSMSPALFVSTTATRLSYRTFHAAFRQLTRQAGFTPRSKRCRPCPMSLRHSFAVNTLTGWYRDGIDVKARLPLLSTWLGHVDPAHTYWYLSATPQLLDLACQRLEASLGRLP